MDKFLAASICLIAISILLYSMYSRIISYKKRITEKTFILINNFHEKYTILQSMLAFIVSESSTEKDFCVAFELVCQEGIAAQTVEELAIKDVYITQEISALFRVIECSLFIKSNSVIVDLQKKLVASDAQLVKAIMEYNTLVRIYNLSISLFPARLIAYFLNAKKINFFVPKAS